MPVWRESECVAEGDAWQSDLVCGVRSYRLAPRCVSATLPHCEIKIKLESGIIHGRTRQKNVNHIVLAFQWGRFLFSHIPQLLQKKIPQPFWSWPKPSKL